MPDIFSKAKRSEIMSCIRSQGNKDTELVLIQIFRSNHIIGWRRHISLSLKASDYDQKTHNTLNAHSQNTMQNKTGRAFKVRPDFIFPHQKLALFVDGCFWHCCPMHASMPKSNKVFWRKKLDANKHRDKYVTGMLRKKGWQVLRIWEHDLTMKCRITLLKRLGKAMAINN